MKNIIKITSTQNNRHLTSYMMNSLKYGNLSNTSNDVITDCIFNIELAKSVGKLLLINESNSVEDIYDYLRSKYYID
jgi:hypothetical protein|nr:MAG TPA: hypothetical protein [Caudoviricetes sp.]